MLHPNWLARLFGAKDRTTKVHQDKVLYEVRWWFDRSGRHVGRDMEILLNDAIDWAERVPLPTATAKAKEGA